MIVLFLLTESMLQYQYIDPCFHLTRLLESENCADLRYESLGETRTQDVFTYLLFAKILQANYSFETQPHRMIE